MMPKFSLPIVPFLVPDKVILSLPPGGRQSGLRPPVEISLEELDDETLAGLIEEFVAAVMIRAGRGDLKNPLDQIANRVE